jgi:hypothetical protein
MEGTDLLFKGARLLTQLRPSATGRRHTGDVVHREFKAAAMRLGVLARCGCSCPGRRRNAGQDAKRRPEARRRHTALSNFHHQSYPQTTRETPSTPPGQTNIQSRWYVEPLNLEFLRAVASRNGAVANGGGVKQLLPSASAAAEIPANYTLSRNMFANSIL